MITGTFGTDKKNLQKAAWMQADIEIKKNQYPRMADEDIVDKFYPDSKSFWEENVKGKDEMMIGW